MAYKVTMHSFTVVTDTEEELLLILLKFAGMSLDSFADYMKVKKEDLIKKEKDAPAAVPRWAINYLKDLLNAELIHLGYTAKDLKAQGIFGGYSDLEAAINKAKSNDAVSGTQPLVINVSSILTEAGTIKIKLLANAEDILQDYINK